MIIRDEIKKAIIWVFVFAVVASTHTLAYHLGFSDGYDKAMVHVTVTESNQD